MKNYLIAFGGKPKPTFLKTVVDLAAADGVVIVGAILCEGPGCYNLAIRMAENEGFVNALTMALMPAKWSFTSDHIEEGQFKEVV